LELGIGTGGQKKLEWWAIGLRKKFGDIFSRLDTINQRDRQTDRQTPGDSKDRDYCTASRGNKNANFCWLV